MRKNRASENRPIERRLITASKCHDISLNQPPRQAVSASARAARRARYHSEIEMPAEAGSNRLRADHRHAPSSGAAPTSEISAAETQADGSYFALKREADAQWQKSGGVSVAGDERQIATNYSRNTGDWKQGAATVAGADAACVDVATRSSKSTTGDALQLLYRR